MFTRGKRFSFLLRRVFLLILLIGITGQFLEVEASNTLLANLQSDGRVEKEVIEEFGRSSKVRVLVLFALPGSGPISRLSLSKLNQQVAAAKKSILNTLPRDHFQVTQTYKSINAIAGLVSIKGIEQLLLDQRVLRIGLDARVSIPNPKTDRSNKRVATKENRDFLFTGFDNLPRQLTGEGVQVIVIDTGFANAGSSVVSSIDSEHCFGSDLSKCPNGEKEQHGHGAALESSKKHGSQVTNTLLGGAPNVRVIAMAVVAKGVVLTRYSAHLRTFDYIANNFPEAKFINYSMGVQSDTGDTKDKHMAARKHCDRHNIFTILFSPIHSRLRNRGIAMFASAGNFHEHGMVIPACVKDVISVGATDASPKNPYRPGSMIAAQLSNFSRFTDVFAPGMGVLTANSSNGTSFSAPIAVACAANLLQAFPQATPEQIRGALAKGSVVAVDPQNWGFSLPRLDCPLALDFLEQSISEVSDTGSDTGGICDRSLPVRSAILSSIDNEKIPITLRVKNYLIRIDERFSYKYRDDMIRPKHRGRYSKVRVTKKPDFIYHDASNRRFYTAASSIMVAGVYTVEGSIEDGMTSSDWSFIITVVDDDAPGLHVQDQNIKLGENLNYAITLEDIDGLAPANIEITSPSFVEWNADTMSFKTSVPPELGRHLITGTISMAGRVSSWSFRVNVEVPKTCSFVSNEQLATVRDLNLSNRELSVLNDGDFAGLTGLRMLDLGRNSLSTLPIDIFAELSGLEVLSLWNNKLAQLPVGVFNGLDNLKWLSLRENLLSSIPQGLFSGLTRLERIWLSFNNLTTFPSEIFSDFSGVRRLDLSANSFSPDTINLLKSHFGSKLYLDDKEDEIILLEEGTVPDGMPSVKFELIPVSSSSLLISEDEGERDYELRVTYDSSISDLKTNVSFNLTGSAIMGTDYKVSRPLPPRITLRTTSTTIYPFSITPVRDFDNSEEIEQIVVEGIVHGDLSLPIVPVSLPLQNVLNSNPVLAAPDRLALTTNSDDNLTVTWNAPNISGSHASVSNYDVEYRVFNSGDRFVGFDHNGIGTITTLAPLEVLKPYEVRVRALSEDGASTWSRAVVGSSQRVQLGLVRGYPRVITSGPNRGTIHLLPSGHIYKGSVQYMPRVHKAFSIDFDLDFGLCLDDGTKVEVAPNEAAGVALLIGKPAETYLPADSLRLGKFAGISPDDQNRGMAVVFQHIRYNNNVNSSFDIMKITHGNGALLLGPRVRRSRCETISNTVTITNTGRLNLYSSIETGKSELVWTVQLSREVFNSLEGKNIAFSGSTGTYGFPLHIKVKSVIGFLNQSGDSHEHWWNLW